MQKYMAEYIILSIILVLPLFALCYTKAVRYVWNPPLDRRFHDIRSGYSRI